MTNGLSKHTITFYDNIRRYDSISTKPRLPSAVRRLPLLLYRWLLAVHQMKTTVHQ